MVPDAVRTRSEWITGETLEAVGKFVSKGHLLVQLPLRVKIHHGVDVVEYRFGRHLRDGIIIIDKPEVARCERIVMNTSQNAIACPRDRNSTRLNSSHANIS